MGDNIFTNALNSLGLCKPEKKDPYISSAAVFIIKEFEGFIAHTYDDKDPEAKPVKDGDPVEGILTIGFGTTDPAYAYPGNKITLELATQLLIDHLNKEVLPTIKSKVQVALTQNQTDALASFIYNIGAGNFSKSTLLKRLNEGNYNEASDEFTEWVYAGGVILRGLVNRRKAEKELFMMKENRTPRF